MKDLKRNCPKQVLQFQGKEQLYLEKRQKKQVKSFQKYYGLDVNGTYDKDTEAKLKEVVNSPLQNGKRHQDIIQLKKDLAKAGFTVPGNRTTLFGKQTENRVKAFQRK